MPNLRPLAEKYLAALKKQGEEFPPEQANAAIEKLNLALADYVTSDNDPLINVFQQVHDELKAPELKPLRTICQAFLDEAHQLINSEYNEQHILSTLPPEIFKQILMPPGEKFDLSLLLLFSEVNWKFHDAAREIFVAYYPKLNYTSPPFFSKITLPDEVFDQYDRLPYTDWLMTKSSTDNQCRVYSLRKDKWIPTLQIEGAATVIATTPIGDAMVLKTPTGFEVLDILTNQRLACENTLFLTPRCISDDLISATYKILLPDKKTLLLLSKLGPVYLNDLSVISLYSEIEAFPSDCDPGSKNIRTIFVTPDGQYLVLVDAHLFERLSVWQLDTKTLHKRIYLPHGMTEKYPSFKGLTVSYNGRSMAILYESENLDGKSTAFFLQWKTDKNASEKATEITLCGIEENAHIKDIAYTPDGSTLVGLLKGFHPENPFVEIRIWNAKNGQCLYKQIFPTLSCHKIDLCITSVGEIILIDQDNNNLTKLKFPHLPADARRLKEKEKEKEEELEATKKNHKNNNSLSEDFFIILLLSILISLASILFATLVLQSTVFILITGAVFLVLGLLVGTAIVFLPRMMHQDCTDQKMTDHAKTKSAENNSANSCDLIAAISGYFGPFFRPKSEEVHHKQVESSILLKI